jgi:hypothetical protein
MSSLELDQNHRDAEYLRHMKEEFMEKKENLDQDCPRFVERVRETILDKNQNGEFLTLGISPAVLTDNFVLQASTFLESGDTTEREGEREPVVVGYWFQKQGVIQDGWLLAKRGGTTKLALLSFPTKNAKDVFFERLLNDVIAVFEEFFPVVVKRDTELESNKPIMTSNAGMELTAALQRASELRARGALRKIQRVGVPNAQVEVKSMPVVRGTVVQTKTRLNPSMTLFMKALFVAVCIYFLRAYLFPNP